MTIGWPSAVASFPPSQRPTMSVCPPGGYGMISRIGLAGQACARAGADGTAQHTSENISLTSKRFM